MGLLFGRRRRSSRKESGSREESASRKGSLTSGIPLMRFVGPTISLAGIASLLFALATGRIDLSSLDGLTGGSLQAETSTSTVRPVELQKLGKRSADTIRLATFNIQIFGKKKSGNEQVMGVLAQIVSQFDLIAIQEVRGGDSVPIQRLVDLLNASGGRYTATVSEPIGRTSQTESYAYVWDENRIQLVPKSAYVVMDTADRMQREPMVASFQVRTGGTDGRAPFRFTLINAHTSPREVAASAIGNEMNVLDDVFVRVRQYGYESTGEEDCILLGDLNVNTKGLRELGQIPGVRTIAGDINTNTRRSKTYDHILIDQNMTREFTGRFGVLDFQTDLGMSEEEALKISDHLPLWAEFSVHEMPRFEPVASRGNRSLR